MSKELRPLDCLSLLTGIDLSINQLVDKKTYERYSIVKSALERLEVIDNAKPSEALEDLNEIVEYITEDKKVKYKATILFDCEIIKDALTTKSKKESVVDGIISIVEEWLCNVEKGDAESMDEIYELLKEVL